MMSGIDILAGQLDEDQRLSKKSGPWENSP